MAQRAIGLFAALAGAAVVLTLLAVGLDADQHTRRWPNWLRRAVAGGLVVLATLGIVSCRKSAAPAGNAATATAPASRPASQVEQLADMLAEPTRVVCGEKGETLAPARRDRLLADLAAAPPLIEAMQNDGRLNQPEAALLQLELDFLRHKLREMPQISGWEKWSMEQAQRNAGSQPADQPAAASQPAESEPSPDPADYWLKKFLPLLQQEAKANDAHPEAVLLALDQIGMALRWPYPSEEEGDVEVSADGGEVNDEQLIPLLKSCRQAVTRILDHLPLDRELEHTAQWERLCERWADMGRLLRHEGEDYPFTAPGLWKKDSAMAMSAIEVRRLAREKLLAADEATLLDQQLRLLRQGLFSYRTLEDQMATCYATSADEGTRDRCRETYWQRLPLLLKLSSEGRLPPGPLRTILADFEWYWVTKSFGDTTDRTKLWQAADRAEAVFRNDAAFRASALASLQKDVTAITAIIQHQRDVAKWQEFVDSLNLFDPLKPSLVRLGPQAQAGADEKLSQLRSDVNSDFCDLVLAGLLSREFCAPP